MQDCKNLNFKQKNCMIEGNAFEEQFKLPEREGVELPTDELERIAGGDRHFIIPACPKCGSGNTTEITSYEFECDDCGYKWSR